MTIRADEISDIIKKEIQGFDAEVREVNYGTVIQVGDNIATVYGLSEARAGEMLLFEKTGMKPSQMDVVESNEAFAVQAMSVTRDLGLDPAKVNPNGGAVALGHPIGATGALLTVKAIHELHRTGGKYALVTMCIGGGQGIAAIFERI